MANISVVFLGADDEKYGPFYLTNGPGWGAVAAWTESESGERFEHLRSFVRDGSIDGTEELGLDLASACELAPEKVANVLELLAEQVGVGDEKETAVIV